MTAQANRDDRILEEALVWQQSLDGALADWNAYTIWLEADPRHRIAADQLVMLDDATDRHRPVLAALLAEPEKPVSRFQLFARPWFAGSIAAAIALVIGLPVLLRPEPVTSYQTEAGQSRTIALPNGATITLAPHSRMTVTGKAGDTIALADGEAYFDVRHDPARTLTISAGGVRVTDIGTRFSINLSPSAVRIGVSDGQVTVAPQSGMTANVTAGHQFVASDGHGAITAIASDDVGSWRAGRLVYSDVPVSLVVADIARYAKLSVTVDARIAASHFSGVLAIGDGSKLVGDLSALMGTRIERDSRGVHIRGVGPAS